MTLKEFLAKIEGQKITACSGDEWDGYDLYKPRIVLENGVVLEFWGEDFYAAMKPDFSRETT